MLKDVLIKWGGKQVTPLEVYTKMFRLGSGFIQRSDEPAGGYKANPVGYYKNDGTETGHFRIFFEDTFAKTLEELQNADFSLLNGVTYFGRRNAQNHASKMCAMIFDLDGVTDETLGNFFSGAIEGGAYPVPNFVALSGHGVHLYYLFDEPISLFPYIKIQLKELKYALTDKIWNQYTSTDRKVQHQGINQGFRILGGHTKKKAKERIISVYAVNPNYFTLEGLCRFVPEAAQVDQMKLWKESKYTLAEAQKKFPEWYEKVVIKGDKSKKYWNIAEKVNGENPYALYDWWKRQMAGASYGHRYFAIMALAIYGAKNDMDFETVKKEAVDFIPFLNSLNPNEPFTLADCLSALECYDLRYKTFPIKDITKLTGIPITPNRRNGRKQKDHMFFMRTMKQMKKVLGETPNTGRTLGRPVGSGTAQQAVADYRAAHPDDTPTQVARALSLSRTTVYKWWDKK